VETSIVGIRSRIDERATVRRSVLLGADYYDATKTKRATARAARRGHGLDARQGHRRQERPDRPRVRLVNEHGVQEADGENYYIRSGIIIVPKGAVVPDGTIV